MGLSPLYDHLTPIEHQQGLSTTMFTVIAITGGVVGIALVAFLTRRLWESLITMREISRSASLLPTTRSVQPRRSHFRPRSPVLDSISGFFVMPLVMVISSWIDRRRRGDRYNNRHYRSGSLRSVWSDTRPMLESQSSVVSHPGELAFPPPTHLATHHGSLGP